MMNTRMGFFESIAQFVGLLDEQLLIVVFQERLSDAIDVISIVASLTDDLIPV